MTKKKLFEEIDKIPHGSSLDLFTDDEFRLHRSKFEYILNSLDDDESMPDFPRISKLKQAISNRNKNEIEKYLDSLFEDIQTWGKSNRSLVIVSSKKKVGFVVLIVTLIIIVIVAIILTVLEIIKEIKWVFEIAVIVGLADFAAGVGFFIYEILNDKEKRQEMRQEMKVTKAIVNKAIAERPPAQPDVDMALVNYILGKNGLNRSKHPIFVTQSELKDTLTTGASNIFVITGESVTISSKIKIPLNSEIETIVFAAKEVTIADKDAFSLFTNTTLAIFLGDTLNLSYTPIATFLPNKTKYSNVPKDIVSALRGKGTDVRLIEERELSWTA